MTGERCAASVACRGCGRTLDTYGTAWSDYYGGPACAHCRAAASFWRDPPDGDST